MTDQNTLQTSCVTNVDARNGRKKMSTRPIDANALRKRIEEWMQELEQEFTVEYVYMGYALDDVLDYIDTAPTIEVKDNG